MNGYYGQSPFPANNDRQQAMRNQAAGNMPGAMGNNMGNNMGGMGNMGPPNQMDVGQMMGTQSLEDLAEQTSKNIRRQSLNMQYGGGDMMDDNTMRRSSMMEFGATSPDLESFQFNPNASQSMDLAMSDMSQQIANQNRQNNNHNRNPNLVLNTQYQNNQLFNNLGSANQNYASPLSAGMDMDLSSPYTGNGMPMSMDMALMTNDLSSLDMFGNQNFDSPMAGSPMHANFPQSAVITGQDSGMVGQQSMEPHMNERQIANMRNSSVGDTRTPNFSRTDSQQTSAQSRQTSISNGQVRSAEVQNTSGTFTANIPQPPSGGAEMIGGLKLPWTTPAGGWPSSMYGRPHTETDFKDVYAPSGFDLLNILMRVATRPNAQINIGAVDLSCAFVVCDAKQHDFPIRYCSESFQMLTGYSKHEIIGQNCRFLQSPDGQVQSGIQRKYCDDDAVLYLKNCVNTNKEAQISLINYRKGGQPFMNLLTMIPLIDEDGETDYFVGFQVDLVERPGAISSKNPDGTYAVNYQRQSDLPSYFMNQPDNSSNTEYSSTVSRDEVTAVLNTIGSGENDISRRILDKVLLENSDDVIHVLSLKGLFLYLSSACRRVLEYEPSDLVGSALSAVCHPSDIVPVTRELKDCSTGASVSVVFRIRRKRNGYMWFESHGSLHTEQGKGRKCIILVGRERPVYTLSKSLIFSPEAGGVGEHEMWTKLSTNGMFLFVSSNVRSLLDRQPEELVGTNIQVLMRPDSRTEFDRVLSISLAGKQTSVKHEVTNRKGQVIQAFSWIYPGDAIEGQKPSFLVAQTRLIKYNRGNQRQSNKAESTGMPGLSSRMNVGDGTPFSVASTNPSYNSANYISTTGHAITHAGQNSLAIGRQDVSLASDDNVFDELKTTRSTSWQFELRQMEKRNRMLAEEVQSLVSAKKKRKRRRGAGLMQKDCANCHTKHTPEWRRGPSGNRDLCNSCGLRWAKQVGRVSPRTNSQHSVHSVQSDKASKASASPPQERTTAQIPAPSTSAVPSSLVSPEKRALPPGAAESSHHAKAAKLEAAASQGYGGGIPEKIEEMAEPDSG